MKIFSLENDHININIHSVYGTEEEQIELLSKIKSSTIHEGRTPSVMSESIKQSFLSDGFLSLDELIWRISEIETLTHAEYKKRQMEERKIIYENKEIDSMKELVEEAIRNGVSLAYADLSYINLKGANLTGGNFYKANFKNTHLGYTTGKNINFEEADMENVNFAKAKIFDSCFTHCNMTSTNLRGADFTGSDFAWVTLNKSTLYRTRFDYVNMEYVSLHDAAIKGAYFGESHNLEKMFVHVHPEKWSIEKNKDYIESFSKKKTDNIIYFNPEKAICNEDKRNQQNIQEAIDHTKQDVLKIMGLKKEEK